MFDSIPKDVLGWTSIILLIILILRFVLGKKDNDQRDGNLHMHQGGTVPIVVPPPPTYGRANTELQLKLHKGKYDSIGDKYWVEAFRIRPTWEGMIDDGNGNKVRAPVKWEITNSSIDGLKGGAYLKEHTLSENVDGTITAKVDVPLYTATDSDIVTFAVYRAKGSYSSIITAEVMKSL